MLCRCLFRVKRVILTVGQPLPVYSDERTSSDRPSGPFRPGVRRLPPVRRGDVGAVADLISEDIPH
jgi:hypothetical protein